jgi:plasmid stability protein
MTNLIVRDIDEFLVRALKDRAARDGNSTEAEHRKILASALSGPRRRHPADVLTAFLDVGRYGQHWIHFQAEKLQKNG